ncbi:MAG: DNA repair protein RecN [Firmicutes bacterium]|nr:DNA repair protein RecN [Bacillota bacterium]MDD4264508.1 DNA repair protein RecN [Bacillota bacterium]MDD4693920.1 DNA repair protein RecN [Bacillota bacterium]
MLLELNVENFALIDKLSLEFGPGLNIVTGETGAGKSILLDAVSLLLGARSTKEMIRSGSEKTRIEGVFDIDRIDGAREICEESGFEVLEGVLIIVREISLDGRSRCYVNGRSSTVGFLSDLGKKLVDLHGQHAHQSLLYPENHLRLLDAFGGENLRNIRSEYVTQYDTWQTLKRRLAKITNLSLERKKQKELLEFQLNELQRATLKEGERKELDLEREKLKSADTLYKLSFESAQLLSNSGYDADSIEVLNPLRTINSNLSKLSGIDKEAEAFLQEASDCLYRLEELARDLSLYADTIEFNPQRLDHIESRLFIIENLQRKYNCASVEELIALSKRLEDQLFELDEDDKSETTLEKDIQEAATLLGTYAQKLSMLREEAFARLKKGVEIQLKDLVMEKATIECNFERKLDSKGIPAFGKQYLPHLGGLENIEFLFSANVGENPKALSKIASGGEISRLMLALKLTLAGSDRIPTLIFDEIDAGIGGKTGQAVAEKLAAIAKYHQVLCVTHLPQIAAFADTHFYIEKREEKGRTFTSLKSLSMNERVEELSRMLAGQNSKQSILHAEEILKKAHEVKSQS